jgi:hypothetical protein
MSSLRIPLLFWKQGTATVPVLEISLAPEGGGATHPSVRRPFEVLDQSIPPLSRQILPTLLPRFPKLEHYSCSYRFPPRDVDQFADDFPRGFSHLLMVSLAFYALGADHTCGGTAFREALRGWTATGYPNKENRIEPVSGIAEKIGAIRRENDEIESIMGSRVTDVMVPLAGEASAVKSEDELRVHRVATFEDALELVFGRERLAEYDRRRYPRRVGIKAVSAGLLLVVVLGAWEAFSGRPNERDPVLRVEARFGDDLVTVRHESGRTSPLGPYQSAVEKPVPVRGEDGKVESIVVGLKRGGPDRGTIIWFDVDESGSCRRRWRIQPFESATEPDGTPLAMGVSGFFLAEVLSESPGPEVVATFHGEWSPSTLAIISSSGTVLKTMWHRGYIGHGIVLRSPTRLVFSACANGLGTPDPDPLPEHPVYDAALFSIRPEDVSGRGPWRDESEHMPEEVSRLPLARFDFYRRIDPKGRGINVSFDHKTAPVRGAEFVVLIYDWYVHVDGEGEIVGTKHGDPVWLEGLSRPLKSDTPPTLIPVR